MTAYKPLTMIKFKKFLLASFFIGIFSFALQAQLSFTKQNNFIEESKSTISLMTSDLNNDQQDDLIVLDRGNRLVVHLNNALERKWKMVSGPVVGYSWAGIIGDFNNDGKKEIVTGSQSTPFRIYTYDYEIEDFTLYFEFDETFFIQNMNVVDINNDGWLDLFLCNDDGNNYTLINDGTGLLVNEEIIDFSTIPVSDKSGNYGSVFLDFDFDGDQDLHIAKCRGFADSYDDPRRINQFYINDGNQNFEDKALDYGIAIGAQSWVADFADLDRDGDNDLIVANHYDDLQILENIENDTFVEVQNGSGISLQNTFWQLSFMDLDNDGYQDVIITADDLYIYLNNGDFTFTPVDLINNNTIVRDFTVTIGDYNNDGFYDLATGYGSLTNVSLDESDSIWLNNGNDNMWIDLVLRGTDSNRDGIGATIYCYQEDKQQIYQIKGGHSYGIMNSTKAHFGLGQDPLDSMKVVWPNGLEERFYDLAVNRAHFIEEGGCRGEILAEQFDDYLHCKGTAITVDFPYDNLQEWNIGSQESTIDYTETDLLFAQYNIDDCPMEAWKIYPHYFDTSTVVKNVQLNDGVYMPCPGEIVEILLPTEDVEWSNGNVGSSYQSKEEEVFTANYLENCSNQYINFERINLSSGFLLSEEIIEYDDGDDISVDVLSEVAEWYDSETEIVPFYTGANYVFENVQEDRVVFIEDHISSKYESFTGLENASSTASVPGSNVSPIINFDVKQNVHLKSIDVYADFAAKREIEIYKSDYTFVYEKEFDVEEGKTTLEIDFVLEPGSYLIKTDEIKNQEYLGSNGPQLFRESQGVSYFPMSDEAGLITIKGNSFNINTAFYAFYNWQVDVDEKVCGIDSRHKLTLQSVNKIDDSANLDVQYNNPIRSSLSIHLDGQYLIKILDLNGQEIRNIEHRDQSMISLEDLNSGYYILNIDGSLFPLVKID